MEFRLDDDTALLLDNLRVLCRQDIEPAVAQSEAAGGPAPDLMARLVEMGLFGLTAAEGRGGGGLSRVATVAVIEALARADAGLAWSVAVHNLVGLAAAVRVTAGDRELTPGAWISGDTLCTLACGESVAIGSDVVRLHADFVPHLGAAGVVIVVDPSVGVVAVPTASLPPPVPTQATGLRTAAFAGIQTECPRAHSRLVGDAAFARAQMDATMLGLAAVALGTGRAALQVGCDYAAERRQFGRPIASFQAIQWKLANMATAIEAATALVRRAAWMVDREDPRRSDAVAQAVVATLPHVTLAASEALQIFGGYGYTAEYPIERRLRDARMLESLGAVLTARTSIGESIALRFAP